MTTHYLEEAERCNRMSFIVISEVVTQGLPSQIKAEPGQLIEIAINQSRTAVKLLKTQLEPWRYQLVSTDSVLT